MTVRVRVRLFAVQRELAGTREVPLELPEAADVEAAWAALVGRYPVLAPGRSSMRFARNGEYADPDTRLADGDEGAMMPPGAGGGAVAFPPQVAGGKARAPARRKPMVELGDEPFTTAILVELADALAIPE